MDRDAGLEGCHWWAHLSPQSSVCFPAWSPAAPAVALQELWRWPQAQSHPRWQKLFYRDYKQYSRCSSLYLSVVYFYLKMCLFLNTKYIFYFNKATLNKMWKIYLITYLILLYNVHTCGIRIKPKATWPYKAGKENNFSELQFSKSFKSTWSTEKSNRTKEMWCRAVNSGNMWDGDGDMSCVGAVGLTAGRGMGTGRWKGRELGHGTKNTGCLLTVLTVLSCGEMKGLRST